MVTSGLCNIRYPSETHLKPKSHEILFVHNLFISYPIVFEILHRARQCLIQWFWNFARSTAVSYPMVLKFCTEHGSVLSNGLKFCTEHGSVLSNGFEILHRARQCLIQWFWNFAQSTAATLPCSVQIFKRMDDWNGCHGRTSSHEILSLRWVSDGYPILLSTLGLELRYLGAPFSSRLQHLLLNELSRTSIR